MKADNRTVNKQAVLITAFIPIARSLPILFGRSRAQI
jgi:hypothetical protein